MISKRTARTLKRNASSDIPVKGVPPQPNYPFAAVPLRVSNIEAAGWCYIVAFLTPNDVSATLPPTLYSHFYITTTNYSKDLRGLLVPLEDS